MFKSFFKNFFILLDEAKLYTGSNLIFGIFFFLAFIPVNFSILFTKFLMLIVFSPPILKTLKISFVY